MTNSNELTTKGVTEYRYAQMIRVTYKDPSKGFEDLTTLKVSECYNSEFTFFYLFSGLPNGEERLIPKDDVLDLEMSGLKAVHVDMVNGDNQTFLYVEYVSTHPNGTLVMERTSPKFGKSSLTQIRSQSMG